MQEGHSVLVYQHYPRVNREAFAESLAAKLQEYTNCHEAFAFHTKHVLFLLAAQKDHARALRQGIDEVMARWAPAIWLHGAGAGAERAAAPATLTSESSRRAAATRWAWARPAPRAARRA